MNYVVQAKPDDLKEISDAFTKQQEAVGEMRQGIVRVTGQLKRGWIGLGSDAFFKELESLILPAVQRLEDALGDASHLTNSVGQQLGNADKEASGPFKEAQNTGGQQGAAAAKPAQAAAAAAQPAAGRVQAAGFGGGAADLRSRGADLGRLATSSSAMVPPRAFSSSDYTPLSYERAEYTPSTWEPSSYERSEYTPSSLGGGGGGSGGGSGGGGGSLGSALGALRTQAGAGFGLSGMASGGAPDLLYSGFGGFGGSGGPRPLDFGAPLLIAAVSPFAALMGKVVKDRTQDN